MWFLFLLLSIAKWIAIASCACSTLAILGVVLMIIRGALKRSQPERKVNRVWQRTPKIT